MRVGGSIDKEQQAAPERLNELSLAAVRGHHGMIEETTEEKTVTIGAAVELIEQLTLDLRPLAA
jgi:hypothetical protein